MINPVHDFSSMLETPEQGVPSDFVLNDPEAPEPEVNTAETPEKTIDIKSLLGPKDKPTDNRFTIPEAELENFISAANLDEYLPEGFKLETMDDNSRKFAEALFRATVKFAVQIPLAALAQYSNNIADTQKHSKTDQSIQAALANYAPNLPDAVRLSFANTAKTVLASNPNMTPDAIIKGLVAQTKRPVRPPSTTNMNSMLELFRKVR